LGTRALAYPVGTAVYSWRLAWAEAKISTIGIAAGSIIAAIITVQMATNMAAPAKDHPVVAFMPAMAMPAIPSVAIPPRTAIPNGRLMLTE
jgi:hypothetical protein